MFGKVTNRLCSQPLRCVCGWGCAYSWHKDVHLRTWFRGGLDSTRLTDRLHHLKGLFRPKRFYDSVICVMMLLAGNMQECNGTVKSSASKTQLFIHLFLLNLNSPSFGCPSSFGCNLKPDWKSFLSSLQRNIGSCHALRIIIKKRIHNGFGVAQSQLHGAGKVARCFVPLLSPLWWEWGWLVCSLCACACCPLHEHISSDRGGSFSGGSPDGTAPGVRSGLAGLSWPVRPLWPSLGLSAVFAAAPSGVPINSRLPQASLQPGNNVKLSHRIVWITPIRKYMKATGSQHFPFYIKWGYDHIKKHNKTYQLLTGDGGTEGLSDTKKAKHENNYIWNKPLLFLLLSLIMTPAPVPTASPPLPFILERGEERLRAG